MCAGLAQKNLQGNVCFLCCEGGWLPSCFSLILLFSHTLPPHHPQWLDFPPGGRGAERTQLCVRLCGKEIPLVVCMRNCHVIVGALVIFAGKWKEVARGNC